MINFNEVDMKVNKVIRSRRKILGLTQEEVALHIGVSVPAVSKWESGTTYPDITILPSLARLLHIDLNTLLSFKQDPTTEEIDSFLSVLSTKIENKNNFSEVLEAVEEKLREYPSSDILAWKLAVLLNKIVGSNAVANRELYEMRIEKILTRLSDSENSEIKYQALSLLCSVYLIKEKFSEAEHIIGLLPEYQIDKSSLHSYLSLKQEKYVDARNIVEKKLTQDLLAIQQNLLLMVNINLKEKRFRESEYYANLFEKMVKLYGHKQFTAYVPWLEIAVVKKDSETCAALLTSILNSSKQEQEESEFRQINSSFNELYESISSDVLIKELTETIDKDPSFSFLHEHPYYIEFLNKISHLKD